MTTKDNPPQIAVWYFIAATFVSLSTVLFFPDADLWARIVMIAVAALLMFGGGIQLGREIRARRDSR